MIFFRQGKKSIIILVNNCLFIQLFAKLTNTQKRYKQTKETHTKKLTKHTYKQTKETHVQRYKQT